MSAPRGEPFRHTRFEALVLPHTEMLMRYARGRVAGEADAEDIVQETCVRAWKQLDTLRDDARVRAWLFRTLHRLACDHHRRASRRSEIAEMTPLSVVDEQQIAGDDDGPFEALLAKLSRRRVREALDEIPKDYALAVGLHDIAGFRYREVAEILEIPLGTVMSRIHRGRTLLAERVAAGGNGRTADDATPARNSVASG